MTTATASKSEFGLNAPTLALLVGAVGFLAALMLSWEGLVSMVGAWARDEYSYGYFVPLVAIYLFLRHSPAALEQPAERSWVAPLVAVLGVILGLAGTYSNISDLAEYGFILAIAALLVAVLGLRAAWRLWPAWVYLWFMVPIPQVLYIKLSAGMQLISSQVGVAFVRVINVPVLLEGNVIDLGLYQLQVAEACSGLRYLFPLMSFGFLFAVLYRGPRWHKLILFFLTIPITVLMNSFRIGVIAVLVDRYGIEQAEGFLHAFEGWIIFVSCLAILFLAAALLQLLAGRGGKSWDMLDFSAVDYRRTLKGLAARVQLSRLWPTVAILAVGAVLSQIEPVREVHLQPRQILATFPNQVSGWNGTRSSLSPDVVEVLAADDFVVANYASLEEDKGVNLFIAYYDTQTDGRAIHSPEVCLPGDGWEIRTLDKVSIGDDDSVAGAVQVNRAIIQKGLNRQLVYYWFEGRGRKLTNEYAVKGYILWDGLTLNRTDGALVRVATEIPMDDTVEMADQRLTAFAEHIQDLLPRYLPQ